MGQPNITLFSAGKFWGSCKNAKEFLAKKGLKFTELNILEDQDAKREMLMISGQHNPPIIKIDDYILPTFDPLKLEEILNNNKNN